MDFLIPQKELQKILDYLVKKPYGEVFELIAIISKLEKIEKEKNNDKKKSDKK